MTQAVSSEVEEKTARLRRLMAAHEIDALLLRRVSSFAWATAGAASFVNTAVAEGAAALLYTVEKRFLLTDNIEAPRFEREEKLADLGFEPVVCPWHEPADFVTQLAGGGRLGADAVLPGATDLSSDLALLRARLLPIEHERLRALARDCAGAMEAAIHSVKPGLSEHQIAAQLAAKCLARAVQPIVILVAADERVAAFRHPLPTGKKLARLAMLVLCGRQQGLVVSLTRLVHFGELSAELRRKAEAVAHVDAAMVAGSRPGKALSEVLQEGIEAYAATGFAEEWKLHHQGGLAGYEPRELVVRLDTAVKLESGMACAWNPSITGTKSEDTILVGAGGTEVLTEIEDWPAIDVKVGGRKLARPAIYLR